MPGTAGRSTRQRSEQRMDWVRNDVGKWELGACEQQIASQRQTLQVIRGLQLMNYILNFYTNFYF